MADSFIQGSFAFTCSIDEAALIEEAWQHAADLIGNFEPASVSPEFLAIFPPVDLGDQLSGFAAIFDDADFPDFGAELSACSAEGNPKSCTVSIFSTTDFQPYPIATLIHRCCKASLADRPVGFEWSLTCSRPYRDSFGGGWCAIFADRIEIEMTREALSKALANRTLMTRPDPWEDDLVHRADDWKTEVANDDTRLGYLDWIEARQSIGD
jgi:hypothetical protein